MSESFLMFLRNRAFKLNLRTPEGLAASMTVERFGYAAEVAEQRGYPGLGRMVVAFRHKNTADRIAVCARALKAMQS